MKVPRLAPIPSTLFALLASAPLLLSPPSPARATARTAQAGARPELRAFWVDGFNDGFKTPAQCDLLLARLRAMHCNAVFVQMRKRADAYYASHYEPWATDDADRFDALAYLCQQGHQPGRPRVQIHAWINACAVGGNATAGPLTRLHPEWLSRSDRGADSDGEATKIDPGNPEAADWTARVYLDVVRHYDVDGIHLDFIRYGGSGATVGHWGYNPVSVARYNARYHEAGLPRWDDSRWRAWRRDQVSALVRRVYVSATALKPGIIVSAATICWGDPPASDADYEKHSASYAEVFAPWRDWMREGILDLNCPMTYFARAGRGGARWAGWQRFVKDHAYGRQCAPGVGLYLNPVADSLAMVRDTRAATRAGRRAAGAVLYCYDTPRGAGGREVEGDTTLFAALPRVFASNVPPPPMPWKEHPKTGQLLGTLLGGPTLTPDDGALVTVTRRDGRVRRTVRADGSGVFALTNLPPGEYGVAAQSRTLDAAVLPGETARLTLAHDTDGLDTVSEVAGIGARPEGARVLLGPVRVSSGSDALGDHSGDHFFVADGPGRATLAVSAPRLVPPAVPGDVVLVAGTLHHTPGGIVVAADAVRLVGIEAR